MAKKMGTKPLPMPSGGKHRATKPHLRTRHLSTAAPSAFGNVGSPQAFPPPGGGAPFDPSAPPPVQGGGGAPAPAMPAGGPGPGM